jgi:hypothetical protein
MSLSNTFFSPKEKIIHNTQEISAHFNKATTSVDRISISVQNRLVQGNFGFVQRFRNTIPLINIVHDQPPPINTKVSIQYHGLGFCWSFESKIISYSAAGHWMIGIPNLLKKNEARRVHRFFLSTNQRWGFISTQALGTFSLRDLSTRGCSLYIKTPNLTLRNNELLLGMLSFHDALSVPIILNVRHISESSINKNLHQKIVGCSFEEIADWGRIQIDDQLQQLPNSDLKRI